MEPRVLVCLDRDGTINLDENYYLGKNSDWKKQIKFLSGVVEGIRQLNSIPNSRIVILTNQSGVALGGEFAELTEQRAHEVNEYIVSQLKKEGAIIHDYVMCPYVDHKYVERKTQESQKKGKTAVFLPDYVQDGHLFLKPNIGMVVEAVRRWSLESDQHFTLKDITSKFMIGDRVSDIDFGLRFGAHSVLIRSYKTKELGDAAKFEELIKKNPNFVSREDDFYQAAEKVIRMCSAKKEK